MSSLTAQPQRPTPIASIVTGAALAAIIVAFFFLPWVSYADYEERLTGWEVFLERIDAPEADDIAIIAASDFETNADATYPPLTVEYTYDGDTETTNGELILPEFGIYRGSNSLFLIVFVVALGLLFAIYELLKISIKQETISAAAWISIIGIYGLLFLIFSGVTHVAQNDDVKVELTRQMILAEGGIESFGFITNEDTDGEVGETSSNGLEIVESNAAARERIIGDTDFSNFRSAVGALDIGFWLTTLAMLVLVGQLFIPRDLDKMRNYSTSDGARVSSGMVVSDTTLLRDTFVRQLVISVAIVFALFPILFIISSAINPNGTLSTQGIIPRSVDSPSDLLVNFRALLVDELDVNPFWKWLRNSFIVASVSTVLVVLITALSAYSFSRFRFAGRRQLLLTVLLIQVFPNLLAMVALFLILFQIGELAEAIPAALPFLSFIDWSWIAFLGLDSLGGLILVYMAGAMGINTWLMKGFFDSIPRDIDESALVDGATHWQIFWLLIFPLVRPILAVVGILAFVGTFNEFVLARILLRDKDNWTLMVGLYNFIQSEFNRDWGKFAAGALVSAVPVVAIYLALQDQIVGGLTAGSVKG